jgi:hypothetical protein
MLGHVRPLHLIHVGASRLSEDVPGDAYREPVTGANHSRWSVPNR